MDAIYRNSLTNYCPCTPARLLDIHVPRTRTELVSIGCLFVSRDYRTQGCRTFFLHLFNRDTHAFKPERFLFNITVSLAFGFEVRKISATVFFPNIAAAWSSLSKAISAFFFNSRCGISWVFDILPLTPYLHNSLPCRFVFQV